MEFPLRKSPGNLVEKRWDGSCDDLSDHDTGTRVHNTRNTLSPVSIKSSAHKWIVPLSALVPSLALVVWIGESSKNDRMFTSLAGSELGGHLTQTQAKGIDFVCSALLAPLLFAGLNLLWFACARVCVVNESARSVPLQTLATASALSRGTYDPLQYYTLLRGRTWRLTALGGITLCSALGASALGVSRAPHGVLLCLMWAYKLTLTSQNMIAYEVFNEAGPSTKDFSLRLLRDAIIDGVSYPSGSASALRLWGLNKSESITAARGVSDVLYELAYESATLNQGDGHVLVDTTSASMANLDKSVTTLVNVPGTRLSAECMPTNVTSMEANAHTGISVGISVNVTNSAIMPVAEGSQDLGNSSNAFYSYIGVMGDTSILYDYAFPAWDGSGGVESGFYLVYTLSGIHSQALPSDYGDLEPTNYYLTEIGSQPAELAPATYWGLRCVLLQQQGVINYTRSEDLHWSMAETAFDEEKTPISSQLSNWQPMVTSGNWAAPDLGVVLFGRDPLKSCLGGHEKCSPTRNISDSVRNYIYASGEIKRIIYDVAVADPSRAAGPPEYYHNVTGTVNKQFYRITYVPVLLLVALVSIILAALLTTALMLSVRNTVSWSWFRQVDVMRLIVDAVGGSLRHQDEHQFAKLSGASDDEILSWAQEYRVSYVEVPKYQSQEKEDFDQVQPPSVQLVH